MVKAFVTCSHLIPPVHTCPCLFTPVHTCSHLFTPVHTGSHRFTPVHTSVTTLFAQWQFRWMFPLQKLLFLDLTCYLVEIAYFAHLIESYLTVYGLSSCIEKEYHSLKQPILQWPCTLVAKCHFCTFESSYSSVLCRILVKLHILTRLIGSFSPRELMELYRNRNVDPCRSPCLKIVNGKRFERRNFSVLPPVLLKNAYFSSANRELCKGVGLAVLQ